MYFCENKKLLCKGKEYMNYKDIVKVFNTCVEENIPCECNNDGMEVLEYLRKSGSRKKKTISEREVIYNE